MIKLNQDGVSGLAISFVLTVLILVGAIVFGAWAFSSRQDYKDNVDSKIADAVTIAKQQESTLKDKQFTEQEKNPLRTYHGPEASGSLSISFPKTWSGYVDDTDSNNNTQVDGYFYPLTVPSISNQGSTFALRVQVVNQPYSQSLSAYRDQQQSSETPVHISPIALKHVPKVVGVKVTGPMPDNNTGTLVMFPLRSQTLQLWTDGDQFQKDFNNIILPNFSFSP